MKKIKLLLILSVLLGNVGCGVSVKLDGFREIVDQHPMGLEKAVESDEGAAFVKALGFYINELERQLEAQR